MYDFYYVNLAAPAGWLLLVCLFAATACHAVTLYLSIKIDKAIHTAQSEVRTAIVSHIAIKEREQLEIWRSARRVCIFIAPLLLAAWLVGLGRP